MARGPYRNALVTVLTLPVLLVGSFFAPLVIHAHLDVMPTFLRPGFAAFWDDVTAYHLRAPGHKTLPEFYAAYDARLVHDFVLNASIYPGLVPSDKAALACWVGMATVQGPDGPRADATQYLAFALAWFPLFYFPVLVFLRTLAKNYTWALCRSERAILLYEEHFDAPLKDRILGGVMALPLVVGMAAWNAYGAMTPDLRRAGFGMVHLTVIYVLLSYMSGLGMRVVQATINGLFISRGTDPDKTIWAELATLALTGPALVVVYHNAILSVLTDAAAGVGPLLVAKLLRRLTTRGPEVLNVLPATAGGPDALARNVALGVGLAVLGGLFLCGGSCLFVAVPSQAAPTGLTVQALESQGTPERWAWLELSNGYLFWPRLERTGTDSSATADVRWDNLYLAPLVSAEVRDEWLRAYRRDGEKANYPYARCRAVIAFHPEDFARLFPEVAAGRVDQEQPYTAFTVRGEVTRYEGAPARVREAIAAEVRDLPGDRLLVIENDKKPLGKGPFGGLMVLGLLAMLPPGIRWLLGWPRRPARAAADVVPVAAPARPRRRPGRAGG